MGSRKAGDQDSGAVLGQQVGEHLDLVAQTRLDEVSLKRVPGQSAEIAARSRRSFAAERHPDRDRAAVASGAAGCLDEVLGASSRPTSSGGLTPKLAWNGFCTRPAQSQPARGI